MLNVVRKLTFLPENCQGPLFLSVKTARAPLFSSIHIMKCKYGQRAAQQFDCHHRSLSVKVKKICRSSSVAVCFSPSLNRYWPPQFKTYIFSTVIGCIMYVSPQHCLGMQWWKMDDWMDGCVVFSSIFLHQKTPPPHPHVILCQVSSC